ncbi:pyridoxal-dependent decarboxylase [Parasphingorhabdus sp.]|uniref:pyridoxal-dependent decarboxylase n=1 Tax=Parasphingorhabdus sp. TaxID=2709688 RepID=UPI003A8DA4A8
MTCCEQFPPHAHHPRVATDTSTGAIDSFEFIGRAAWTHIDAAWAGPLRLCDRYADRLAGVEKADSVAISAHKWLFQPKEAGLILFQDVDAAHQAICFGGAYLTRPNVGVLGSHGANAVALLATLLALGRQGIAERIERCVAIAEHFASFVADDARLELHEWPTAGVVNWRPIIGDTKDLLERLPDGSTSTTRLSGDIWLRNVAANPNVDIKAFIQSVECALPARSGG